MILELMVLVLGFLLIYWIFGDYNVSVLLEKVFESVVSFIIGINGSNIYVDDVIYDGMGGGDGKINFGSYGEVDGGSGNSVDYVKYEKSGIIFEESCVDNFGVDGVGNVGININGVGKFYDRGENYGLEVGYGLGSYRGGL